MVWYFFHLERLDIIGCKVKVIADNYEAFDEINHKIIIEIKILTIIEIKAKKEIKTKIKTKTKTVSIREYTSGTSHVD